MNEKLVSSVSLVWFDQTFYSNFIQLCWEKRNSHCFYLALDFLYPSQEATRFLMHFLSLGLIFQALNLHGFQFFFLWFTLNLLGIGRKENFQIYIANNFFKVSSFVAAKMTTTEEDLGTDLVKRYSFNNCIYSRIKSFWRVFSKILHDFTVQLHVVEITKIHSGKIPWK